MACEPHGLSDQQIACLRAVLVDFAEKIDLVGLFGSRATGKARPNSDVDLVLYGRLNGRDLDRLWTLFEDSNLSLHVDLSVYDLIESASLKSHIDRVMQPLFTKEDLFLAK